MHRPRGQKGQRSPTDLRQLTLSCVAEELDDVVKAAGVGHVRLDDWIQLVKVVGKHVATHDALASMHQVHVASQRVDLTVVSYESTHTSQLDHPDTPCMKDLPSLGTQCR